MKITEINRKKTYYEVTAGDTVYEIDGELLRQYHIQTGEIFDTELLEMLHRKSRFRRAYRRACYLLDEREYSYCTMYQKLMHTYQDKPLCTKVMEELIQCGAINDRRYAKKFAEYLVEYKHYGLYRVRQELLRKGIDKELTEQSLQALRETAQENLPEVLAKKYGKQLIDPEDYKVREKVIAGMTRLGYDYAEIKNAIEDFFAEQEDSNGN